MAEIIELLDSDDEEDDCFMERSKMREETSLTSTPSPKKRTQRFLTDYVDQKQHTKKDHIIEIIDDDTPPLTERMPVDDITETKLLSSSSIPFTKKSSTTTDRTTTTKPSTAYFKKARTTTTPKTSSMVPSRLLDRYANTDNLDSDSDSDDSLLNSSPIFLKKSKTKSPSPEINNDTIRDHSKTNLESKTNKNTSTENTKKSSSNPSSYSGSDCENNPFPYPSFRSTSENYEDLRATYILCFWRYARNRTQNSYDRAKLNETVKKINCLALTPYPIRSLEEYCSTGSGSRSRDDIKLQLTEGGLQGNAVRRQYYTPATNDNKYYSIAEACLVAMLTEIERRHSAKGGGGNIQSDEVLCNKDMWVSLEFLIPAIDRLLSSECPSRLTKVDHSDFGASHYLDPSTRSAEFLQIQKLEGPLQVFDDNKPGMSTATNTNTGRIKRHTRRGEALFQLTPLGFENANYIRKRQLPAKRGHYRCSRIVTMNQVGDSYKDVCIGVDIREGGGPENALHDMCNELDRRNVPFFVGKLDIGDYVFFSRKSREEESSNIGDSSLNYLCPILVERKSVQDLAESIHDGRWESQKKRMYIGQYVFGYNDCEMAYIIEGSLKTHTVTGGYIGNAKFNVSIERYNKEVEKLKLQGFKVIESSCRKQTMSKLAEWSRRIADKIRQGTITVKYTYSDFIGKVKKIPKETDFSRISIDMASRKQTASLLATPTPVSHPKGREFNRSPSMCDATSKKKIEVLGVSTPESTKNTSRAAELPESKLAPSAKRRLNLNSPSKYSGWKVSQLQQECGKVGLPKTGTKSALIERLNGIHPPKLWLQRKNKGKYVPAQHDTCGSAILVALYLHEKDLCPDQLDGDGGMSKDDIFNKTEKIKVSKVPLSEQSSGTYAYDGWSSMTPLLQNSDPALVMRVKGGRYKLTRSGDFSGYNIARVMHQWAHQYNACHCGENTEDFE